MRRKTVFQRMTCLAEGDAHDLARAAFELVVDDALSQRMVRKANKEDGCKGRFWEGRFSCQPLLDEAAVLTCMAYVDLNPVRAGMAKGLEQSEFTSIHARLAEAARAMDEAESDAEAVAVTPENEASDELEASAEHVRTPKRRATGVVARQASELSRNERKQLVPSGLAPFVDQAPERDSTVERDVLRPLPIPMKFVDYVELLEWTGRTVRHDKRGAIRGDEPELLTRLRLNPDAWLHAMAGAGLSTTRVLGSVDRVRAFAERRGVKRAHGVGFAQKLAA